MIGKEFNPLTLAAAEVALGDASDSEVSRWIIHVTAQVGGITVKGRPVGQTLATRATITARKRADDTTVTSITATGIYDIDAAGLDVSLTAGTSGTVYAIAVVG